MVTTAYHVLYLLIVVRPLALFMLVSLALPSLMRPHGSAGRLDPDQVNHVTTPVQPHY